MTFEQLVKVFSQLAPVPVGLNPEGPAVPSLAM